MSKDVEKLNELHELARQGTMKLQEYKDQARIDLEFYLGRQHSRAEEEYLRVNNRAIITNNKIRRGINMISGYQRTNQLSSVVMPQINEYQEIADLISSGVMYLYTKRNGYSHLADCFLYGPLITGINFSEIVLDYSKDTEVPDIKFVRIPYNGAIWDPYFSEPDMSDCGYFIRRKIVNKNYVLSMLPDYAKEIKKMETFTTDGIFLEIPAASNPNGQEQLAYTEFWYKTIERRSIIIDARTRERVGIVQKGKEDLAEQMMFIDKNRAIIKIDIPTVKMNIFINEHYIDTVDDPLGINEYPFVPFFGIYIPEHDDFSNRLQAVQRVSRDPQSELNKRLCKFVDIMDSKIHNGYMFKKKALADGEDPYKGGNFKSIALKKDAVIGQDIQQIVPTPSDPSVFQSFGIFDQNIIDNLGLNEATLGMPQGGNDSGLLTMLRQQTAALGLQPILDSFYRSQYYHTQKSIRAMQVNWPNFKWERVTGMKIPSPNFRDPQFIKYDVQITQSVMSENQQKLYFGQLVQLRELGVNINDEIMISEAPLQGKTALTKKLAAMQQQKAQAAAKQEALMQEQIALANEKTKSEIRESESEITRRNSRAFADVSLSEMHVSEGLAAKSKSSLDQVKTAQEIIQSDQGELLQALQFVDAMVDEQMDESSKQMLLNKAITDSYIQGSGFELAQVNQQPQQIQQQVPQQQLQP